MQGKIAICGDAPRGQCVTGLVYSRYAIGHRSVRYLIPSPVFLSSWLHGTLSDMTVGKGLAPSGSTISPIGITQCGKVRGKGFVYYEFALHPRLSYRPPPEGAEPLPYILIERRTVYPTDKQQFVEYNAISVPRADPGPSPHKGARRLGERF